MAAQTAARFAGAGTGTIGLAVAVPAPGHAATRSVGETVGVGKVCAWARHSSPPALDPGTVPRYRGQPPHVGRSQPALPT